jgi:hypothetical protein
MVEKTCLVCGKRFLSWRGKQYCSEAHRKIAENRRLRGDENRQQYQDDKFSPGVQPHDIPESEKIAEENQPVTERLRGDESPAYRVAHAKWIACNDVTQKLDYKGRALGWLAYIEGRGWYGRIRDERGNLSYGPCRSISRCQRAVEALIKHEPFDKVDNEASWRGDLGKIFTGRDLYSTP